MKLIVDSKVSTLIVYWVLYKVVKLTLPFLSQVIAVRTVAHKDVTEISKDKHWTAIGFNGENKKHNDEALCYIHSFGENRKW